jgi:hypothetical protein
VVVVEATMSSPHRQRHMPRLQLDLTATVSLLAMPPPMPSLAHSLLFASTMRPCRGLPPRQHRRL